MASTFIAWVKDTAAAIAKDPEHAEGCTGTDMTEKCYCGFIPSTREQRLAIALVQARALECRDRATELQIRGYTQNPLVQAIFAKLWERSHNLEKLGLLLCDQYPPPDDATPENSPEPKSIIQ